MCVKIPLTLLLLVACAHGASLLTSPGNGNVAGDGQLSTSAGKEISLDIVQLNHVITKRNALDESTSSRRRRRRRKESSSADEGLLKAKKIKAEQLKTESLKARQIEADRIKSDAIISESVIVTSKRRRRPSRKSYEEPVTERTRPPTDDYTIIGGTKGIITVDDHLPRISDKLEKSDRTFVSSKRRSERRNSKDSFQSPVETLDRLQSERRLVDFQDIQGLQPDRKASRRSRRKRPKSINDFQLQDSPAVLEAQAFSSSKPSSGLGLLDAREISANSIRARSMKADRITADRIRSKNVDTKTLQIDNRPFSQMSLFVHPSQKTTKNEENKSTQSNSRFENGHPSGMTKQQGPNYDVPKEEAPVIPNFQLLGISTSQKPELQMYIERPVWRQPIRSTVDEYFPNEPQVKIYLNSFARDKFRSSSGTPMQEYITDNYSMGRKSLNSFSDFHFS